VLCLQCSVDYQKCIVVVLCLCCTSVNYQKCGVVVLCL